MQILFSSHSTDLLQDITLEGSEIDIIIKDNSNTLVMQV